MSPLAVVDASVALKWVVTEAGSDAASALLTGMASGEVSLVAPEHLIGELGNGLRKRVAQGVLSADDALAALDAVAGLELKLVGGPDRWFRSLRAHRRRHHCLAATHAGHRQDGSQGGCGRSRCHSPRAER